MENKAILFLSHLIPKEYDDAVRLYSKHNMQDAANALQWHLAEGFSHHLSGRMDVINYMPIASYPQYYKKAFIRKGQFDAGMCSPGVNVGFCNVKYLRRASLRRALTSALKAWCRANAERPKEIIAYTLNPIMLEAVASVKRQYGDISVCAIVADLPDMMNLSAKRGRLSRLASERGAAESYRNLKNVDRFVFLTRQMADYIGTDKPFCVMEGIAPDREPVGCALATDEKTVLYTGTLHRKFGVLHLLEAFSLIEGEEYRLVICGAGDSEKEIREAAEKDPRILYKGQCPREQALRLQREATVLVNPRMNNEEYTKYSFPSKNLEYLASGVPLVAYKLDGIPEEYGAYIRYVSDDSSAALAKEIRAVCECDASVRAEMGARAARFVREEKNKLAQTKKILNLIRNQES